MKSFLFKALALAFAVIAGSANAYPGEATVNKTCKLISKPYTDFYRSISYKLDEAGYEKTAETLYHILRFPYEHYIVSRTVFALGVAAVTYKTYKHVTKPAADATEEGENIEANETTVEVA